MTTITPPAQRIPPRRPAGPPPELVHDAVTVAKRTRRVSRQLDELEARRREIVAQLIENGLEQQDVARLLDISRQRVSQIVANLRAEGRLPD